MIGNVNKEGYNKLAPNFFDEKRITTSNFHEVTKDFFQHAVDTYVKKGNKILELGPGKDWLTRNIIFPEVDYYKIEIAEQMIEDSRNTSIASVDAMPFEEEDFDYIFSSLGDPYFYEEALKEICRVLKKNGLFIFSAPSHEWAKGLRGNKQMSTFIDEGKEINVYSFTYSNTDMRNLWRKCGFTPIMIQDCFGSGINGDISKDVIKSANNLSLDYRDLSIATVAVFKKL